MTHHDVQHAVATQKSPKKAASSAWFFKTGPGDYGEGDQFAGLSVPQSRTIATHFRDLPLSEVSALLDSPIHEERLIALLILVAQYKRADESTQTAIKTLYLSKTDRINNWDLVDTSADKIVGEWVHTHQQPEVLTRLAVSKSIWERRIAILSTFAYLRVGDAKPTQEIADLLLHDREDLIHKAVGWLLREMGKRISKDVLTTYLASRYKTMPRTMLRYAIEHYSATERTAYLRGTV